MLISKLTDQAEYEHCGENKLDRSAILHVILRSLKLSLDTTIPAVPLFLIIITAIKAAFTLLVAHINTLHIYTLKIVTKSTLTQVNRNRTSL